MSRKYEVPNLPEEIAVLADDILEELMIPEHAKREHGVRNTYVAGCRGPLCRRADRKFNRDRYAERRAAEGKPYQPSDLRRDARDEELDSALEAYSNYRHEIEVIARLRELYRELGVAI